MAAMLGLDHLIGSARRSPTFADRLGPNLNGMNGFGGVLTGLNGLIGGAGGGAFGMRREEDAPVQPIQPLSIPANSGLLSALAQQTQAALQQPSVLSQIAQPQDVSPEDVIGLLQALLQRGRF